jgi:hypothetical protein
MKDTELNLTGSSATVAAMAKRQRPKEELRQQRAAHLDKVRVGRTKGAKGKLTLLREAVLEKAETMVLKDWEDVVQQTLTLAKEGDSTCLKILWDRVIPSKRAIDESKSTKDKLNITINVEGMAVKAVMDEPVEAEFTEVEDD